MSATKDKSIVNINLHSPDGDDSKIGKVNAVFNLTKNSFKSIANASYAKIFKVMFTLIISTVCIISGMFAYNVAKNQETVVKIINELIISKQEDAINMKVRDMIKPKIDNELKKTLYSFNADRTAIFELHNGKENATRLPFKYVDMSYEEVDDNNKEISYISEKYQNVPLTFYRIPYYVSNNTYFIGTIDDIRKIDNRFAREMERIGGKYMCIVMLRSNGNDIGFLCIFFDSREPILVRDEVTKKLNELSKTISPLLDLSKQRKKYDENGKY